jgi:hypothetical protein
MTCYYKYGKKPKWVSAKIFRRYMCSAMARISKLFPGLNFGLCTFLELV